MAKVDKLGRGEFWLLRYCWGCQACRSVFVKILVKFDLEFDLKFEISDGKNLVKFWGRAFLPARKARKISGRISWQISDQISEKFSETSFQISGLLSGTSFSRRAVLRHWAHEIFTKNDSSRVF